MAISMSALLRRIKAEKSAGGPDSPAGSPASAVVASASSSMEDRARDLIRGSAEPLPDMEIRLSADKMVQLPGLPTVHCVEDALSEEAAAHLEAFFYHPSQQRRWVVLKGRSLQMYGGTVTGMGVLEHQEPLPPPLQQLCSELVRLGLYSEESKPNHALVNLYLPGQGILPHTDGPAYYPKTTTISLGCPAIMVFSERRKETVPVEGSGSGDVGGGGGGGGEREVLREVPLQEVILRPRSAVVFEDEAYTRALHSIPAVAEETVGGTGAPCVNAAPQDSVVIERSGPRISITLRHVNVNVNVNGGKAATTTPTTE